MRQFCFFRSNRASAITMETIASALPKAEPKAAAQPKPSKPAPQTEAKEAAAPAARKLSYAEQRERDKTLRRAAKRVEEAEAAVSAREAALAEIEAKIAAGEVAPEIFTAHAEATKAVENAMSVWELAQMELDELKQQ